MSTSQVITKFELPKIPDVKEAEKLCGPLLRQAENYSITDEDGYLASWAMVERCDTVIAKLGAMFDPLCDGLFKLHRMATGLRQNFLDPAYRAKQVYLDKRGAYRREQKEIAEKKAAADAEELRKKQQKELMAEAKRQEKSGQAETAEVLREQAKELPLPAVMAAPAVPKQAGSVERGRWQVTIINPDLVPREYCQPSETLCRKQYEATGARTVIPGVTAKWIESEYSKRAKS